MDLLSEFLHTARNGLDLGVGLTFTNDEPGSDAVLDGLEIHDADALSLDLLDALHNRGDQGIGGRTIRALGHLSGRGCISPWVRLCLWFFHRALK